MCVQAREILETIKPCKSCKSKYFDFVSIHGCVGNQDLGILNSFWLINSNFFIQQKPWEQKDLNEEIRSGCVCLFTSRIMQTLVNS